MLFFLDKESSPILPRVLKEVASGDVMTPGEEKSLQTRSNKTGTDVQALIALAAENTVLKRWVKPEEVAQAVLLLEHCNAMTGTILNLSAGATIH